MRYLTGLMVLPTRKNVLSISRSFVDGKDQSSVNNFITDSGWDEKAFHDAAIKMVRDEAEKRKITRGVLVIDDTFSEKKTGKHIEGVGTYWDHSQNNKYILAHNNIITAYYDVTREFSVVLDSLCRLPEERRLLLPRRVQNQGGDRQRADIKGSQLWAAPHHHARVVFDTWYATRELIGHIEALGINKGMGNAGKERATALYCQTTAAAAVQRKEVLQTVPGQSRRKNSGL